MLFDENPAPDLTIEGSGGAASAPPNWSSPPGTATCAHDLCTVAGPLDADCHPCVARVCDKPGLSHCCDTSGGWEQACVDEVYVECGDGSAPPPLPASVCDYAALTSGSLSLADRPQILGGALAAAGSVAIGNCDSGRVLEELVSGGSISLGLGCQIVSDVTAGGAIAWAGAHAVGGVETSGATVALPTLPSKALSCLTPSGSLDVNDGTVTISPGDARRININGATARVILNGPGSYGYVHFNAAGTLVFAGSGVYSFDTLWMGANDPLLLFPPSGAIHVDVCRDLEFQNRTRAERYSSASGYAPSGLSPSPLAVHWYTHDTQVRLGTGALAEGSLLAPYADIVGGAGTTVRGLLYARTFNLSPDFTLDASGLVGSACRVAGVDLAAPTEACPVGLTLPGTPAPREPCFSGLDCQLNSRCTEVLTRSGCEHSKCIEGGPLTASCDECVERICVDTPTCCENAWTSECVNKVKTLCDASCGATTGGCAHGVCDVGEALDSSCDSCAATVCAYPELSYCCSTGWDSMCASSADALCGAPGSQLCDYGFFAEGRGWNYAAVLGGAVGGGSAGFDVGAGSNIGNFYGTGPAWFNNAMARDVISLGVIGAWGTSQLDSATTKTSFIASPALPLQRTVDPSLTAPLLAIPERSIGCPTTGEPSIDSGSKALAPGSYGDLNVNNVGTILQLVAGTYFFNRLNLNDGTVLRLPATGDVHINLCAHFNIGQNVRFEGPGGAALTAADAKRFDWYWQSAATATIGRNVKFFGVFTAPNGEISIDGCNGSGCTVFTGMFRAYRGHANAGVVIDASAVSKLDCLRGGYGDGAPGACPIATPVSSITETGTCVGNDETYIDPSCPDVDLAVDFGCGNALPVCNHGNVALPANEASLVFYPRQGQQFASETPDPMWAVGSCLITQSIAPGSCISQRCDAHLVDEDLTVFASLNADASVDECSHLDNWSYYVEGQACSGALPPLVEEQTYEAVCPDNAGPRWGLLAWDAETPGASRITFEARAAATEVALASGTYEEVGIARAVPSDSQVCPLGGTAPRCPSDVSGELGLPAANQHAFLQVRATLFPEGPNAPTLRDWQITYSCVFDE